MVDEFQDTDPVQWDIVRTAFGDGATTLVLIGDPKQAIYAFRGADVHTYLDAASHASTVATLARNWRSDQDLVDGVRRVVRRRHARPPGHRVPHGRGRRRASRRPGCANAPHAAALRVRVADRDNGRVALTRQGWASNDIGPARRWPPTSPPTSSSLLSSGAELVDRVVDGAETAGRRPSGRRHRACWWRPTVRERSCATRSRPSGCRP